MTTTYTKSNGQLIQIADMPFPYLQNALNKAERDEVEKKAIAEAMGDEYETTSGRAEEIAAMRADLERKEQDGDGTSS